MQPELARTILERQVIVKLLRQTAEDKARLAEPEGALLAAYASNEDLKAAAEMARTSYARLARKIKAVSASRHRRNGRTITTFYVWFDGDTSTQCVINEGGATPGARKTCAMQTYLRLQLAKALK